MDNDLALFKRYQSGEELAFEMLYQRYKQGLFRFIFALVKSQPITEEIYSETWLSIINKKADYDGRNFKSLVYTIAYRKSLNILKNQEVGRKAIKEFCHSPCHSIELNLESPRQELSATLDELSLSLSPKARQTFQLRIKGLSYQEIAQITKVSLGTVKSRLFNTVVKLRNQVRKYEL